MADLVTQRQSYGDGEVQKLFSLLPSKDKAALQGNSEEQFRSLGIRFRVFESSSKKGFGLRGL